MSFSSILSNPSADAHPPSYPQRVTEQAQKPSQPSNHLKSPTAEETIPLIWPHRSSNRPVTPLNEPATKATVNGASDVRRHNVSTVIKPRSIMSDKENEKVARAMADIDAMELSDVEEPGFSDEKEDFRRRSLKRTLDVETIETGKRKVRCPLYSTLLGAPD